MKIIQRNNLLKMILEEWTYIPRDDNHRFYINIINDNFNNFESL